MKKDKAEKEDRDNAGAVNGDSDRADNQAPLLGSWTAWYVLVFVVLLLSIGALYLFTKHFS